MHHRIVERLARGRSPVHRLDPRAKILCSMLTIFLLALLPDGKFIPLVMPAALVLSLLVIARLPWWFVVSRTLLVLPFVLLVTIFLPWTYGQEVIWCSAESDLCMYREGLLLAFSVAAKGMISILWIEMVVFTTPILEILSALRSLKVPRIIVETLSFLFRYLDLLVDESQRVKRARLARQAGGRRLVWSSSGGIVGRIFLRAIRRAERIWMAMQARGYRGELFIMKKTSWSWADTILAFVAGTVFVSTVLLAWKLY